MHTAVSVLNAEFEYALSDEVYVCVCVFVCVCMCVRARVYAHITHVFAVVCLWRKKPKQDINAFSLYWQ